MRTFLKTQLTLTAGVLRSITGNARACVALEPLWGVPYNLFMPYASLYMLALGVNDTGVGIIASVGLVFQTVCSLLGGYITDRLGRRRTSLLFDMLAWSVPTLIWAASRDFTWFLAAAVLNSVSRVVHTSWSCLMIEDTPPADRVNVYTWLSVAGILAGFFAPLAGIFVKRFGLVPSVRGLYLFSSVSMTAMFLLRNRFTVETAIGRVKMEEAKTHGLRELFSEYRTVLRELVSNPLTMTAFAIMVLNQIQITIRQTFQSIVFTRGIGLSQESVALFPALSSAVSLLIYVFVMPSVRKFGLRRPLAFGIVASVLSNLLLILAPEGSYLAVTLSTLAGAVGVAFVIPFVDTIVANSVDDRNRAKILALLYTMLFAIATPFGYIGGLLSSIEPRLTSVLLTALFCASFALLFLQRRLESRAAAVTCS